MAALSEKMFTFFIKRPNLLRILINIWPPFVFSGIQVKKISGDYKYSKIKLLNWPGTRNMNGSQYGGSLCSMTDPMFGTMLYGILGKDKYYIWDKSTKIDFINPGIGAVFAEFHITDEQINNIIERTKNGEKFLPIFHTNIVDKNGKIVAAVQKEIYIRLKPEHREKP